MSRFSHIASRAIKNEKTSEFIFEDLIGRPALDLAYTGSSNKPYLNARLAATGKGARRKTLATVTEAIRKTDRKLFPKHVIKGWRNVQDAEGADVPFSVEAATELVDALPEDMFDEARAHAEDPSNYRDELPDMDETAKNLGSG